MDNADIIAQEAMRQIEVEKLNSHTDHNIKVIRMSDITEKPIEWLWLRFIALGKLAVIAGNPGLGKSQLLAYIASIVSNGWIWLDYSSISPKGSVIFLSAEDDPADTIKPRLMAAGADVDKCYIVESIGTKMNGKDGERTFDLTKDVERLGALIEELEDVKVIMVDPITAYCGSTDSNNNADMRALLAPLAAMAAKYNVAVLLVTHLNKSQGQDILARVIGSIGLVAAARAGFVVSKDQQDPNRRYFLPIKNNIGNDTKGFAYAIESITLSSGITTSRIVWQAGTVEAQDILNPPPKEKVLAATEAIEWLSTLLAAGHMTADDIYARAHSAGFSDYQLHQAKRILGIRSHKQRNTKNGPWMWSLPKSKESSEQSEEGEGSEESNASEVHVSSYSSHDRRLDAEGNASQETQSSPSSMPSILQKL